MLKDDTGLQTGNRRGQGGPEFNVVVSFVLVIFLIVMFIVFQKQDEAYNLQLSIDAKRVLQTVADNINMIAKNGDGYYRYFSVPTTLYGYTEYNISSAETMVEINYGENWAATAITQNVSILSLQKGDHLRNCILNDGGEIVINDVCGLSDQGCGEIKSCDPGDADTCTTCNTPAAALLHENSISRCGSYACEYSPSSLEWHLYRVVPSKSGQLAISFSSTGTMAGSDQTDLIFYDYTTNGCNSPIRYFDLEESASYSLSVVAGRTYVIGLDTDADNCSYGGSYVLTTKLT